MLKLAALHSLALACVLAIPVASPAQSCALDPGFDAGLNSDAYVAAVATQTNGAILIGGAFSLAGTPNRVNVARLHPDGSLDSTFNAGAAADLGPVYAIAVQTDGKVILGGSFYSSTGIASPYLARLNVDGTVDGTFHPNVGGPISAVVLQPDGKILIAGSFLFVEGLLRSSVARLNSNGTLDVGFDACAGSSPDGANAMALMSDGKILLAGKFTFSIAGVTRDGISLLNTNGDVIPSFLPDPGVSPGGAVYAVAVRSTGEILIGGYFDSYNGVPRSGIAQISPESGGIVDPDFNPGTGFNYGAFVFSLALERSGKVVVGGSFTSYNNETRNGVARLNADGSLEPGCEEGVGDSSRVNSIAVGGDGKALVGGYFTCPGSVTRNALVRLKGETAPFHLDPPTQLPGGQFQMLFHGQAQTGYAVQTSSNLIDWISFTNFTCSSTPMSLTDPETNSRPARFYRGLLLP